MLPNNVDACRCSYFELELPVRELIYCWQVIVLLLILRPIVLFVLKIVPLVCQSLRNIDSVMDETSNAVDKIWCPPLIPELFLLSPKNQEKRMISSWHRHSLE